MRHSRLLMGAITASALIGGGFTLWKWKEMRTRVEWRQSIPAAPDLAGKSPELRRRLTEARTRAESSSRNAAAMAEFTLLCLANGFDHEGEKGLGVLITLQPQEPRWPHLLAKLLAGYGRLPEALAWHEKTVALAPNYLPARINGLRHCCDKTNPRPRLPNIARCWRARPAKRRRCSVWLSSISKRAVGRSAHEAGAGDCDRAYVGRRPPTFSDGFGKTGRVGRGCRRAGDGDKSRNFSRNGRSLGR